MKETGKKMEAIMISRCWLDTYIYIFIFIYSLYMYIGIYGVCKNYRSLLGGGPQSRDSRSSGVTSGV